MANPHKGDVEFVAGDKTYTLRYSIDAICTLEDRTEQSLLEISADLQKMGKSVRMSLVREMLYAGLTEHHPEITVKEAGELIMSGGGAIVLLDKVNAALIAAFPAQDGKGEASGTPRPPQRRNRHR